VPALGQTPTLFGDPCRALERFLEGHTAEALQHRVVAGNRAGHRGRVDAITGHARGLEAVGEEVRRPSGGRPTCGVERIELLVLRRPDDGEEITADTGVVLRGHVEHGGGRDSRVDGVAAVSQDLEAGLRRKRIACGHHAVAGQHLRAALREPALRARSWSSGDPSARLRLVGRWAAKRIWRLRDADRYPRDQQQRAGHDGSHLLLVTADHDSSPATD
jgi:hypothetical protein